MKIYTKRGDKGKTSLVSGRRVMKNELIIEAYGTIDELNACVGLLSHYTPFAEVRTDLLYIQNMLFNIGSILAKDEADYPDYPTLEERDVRFLEEKIDEMNAHLEKMTSFILPAGSESIAQAHICRTICRRAERRVIDVDNAVSIPLIVMYLNRLSDYFFILARYFHNKEKVPEIKWDNKIRDELR